MQSNEMKGRYMKAVANGLSKVKETTLQHKKYVYSQLHAQHYMKAYLHEVADNRNEVSEFLHEDILLSSCR